jgi:hypothetical protein
LRLGALLGWTASASLPILVLLFRDRLLATIRAARPVLEETYTRLRPELRHVVRSNLQPPKLIVFATAEDVASIGSARPVPVRLSPDVLAAEALVLVPFDGRASR